MIHRRIYTELLDAIDGNPAVALLGPRQVGKTTLALEIGNTALPFILLFAPIMLVAPTV
jgi:predicted AAA+ superfamily ATPase